MKRIWTNGCYDILHIGHVRLFQYAKSLGDILIVGIDSDERVKELKGNNRPFNNENTRKEILLSNKYIDEVFIFNSSDDMCRIVQDCRIYTIVIGGEYSNRFTNPPVVAANFVKELIFFPMVPNISTTKILKYEENINNGKNSIT